MKGNKGFTLVELLVVIGIIAILAGVVIVALNPARQFAQARNTQRWSNVNTLLNAVSQRLADNRGSWPTDTDCLALPTSTTSIGTDTGLFDLAACVVPTYVASMVYDPSDGSLSDTYYQIIESSGGRVTVSASTTDLGEDISATR